MRVDEEYVCNEGRVKTLCVNGCVWFKSVILKNGYELCMYGGLVSRVYIWWYV